MKHRLPAATSVKDITISLAQNKHQQLPSMLPPRDTNSHRNGKLVLSVRCFIYTLTSFLIVIKATDATTGPLISTPAEKAPTSKPLTTMRKGFRPIGQANAALKHFFPGDEDDNNDETTPLQATPALAHVTMLPTNGHHDQPSSREENTPALNAVHTEVPIASNPPNETAISRQATPKEDLQETTQEAAEEAAHIEEALDMSLDNDNEDNDTTSPVAHADLYAIVSQVGEGTFGKVYKAKNTITQVHVALKRIRMESERDGFPVTAMREIKLLQSLEHVNIVRLHEMMVSNGMISI